MTSLNVLPPVQKCAELQKRPLEVSKDFDKILPSSKVLPQSAESFECPFVHFNWMLNRGSGVGDNLMKWILHGRFQSLPFDFELIQHMWIDDMDVGMVRMSFPHQLIDGASEDVGGSGGI